MAAPAVVDLHRFLLGGWRIEREILASDGTVTGHFRGSATFAPDPDVAGLLRYVEHGTLTVGDHQVPASRRLGYHVTGASARVVFEDGRAFHDLDLRHGVDEVAHPCRADHYRGRFELLDDDRWRHTWTVTGPAKDHRIVTALEREPAGPRA